MKVTDVLHAQHGELRGLLKALAAGADEATRERLAAALQLHTRLEETFFYPAVREHERRNGDLVAEAYEEHGIADVALARLMAADLHSEQGLARVRVLQTVVEHHLEAEEHDLFKRAERLGDDRLKEIGAAIQTELEEVARVDALLGRAATAAQRTERWAGRWLDMGVVLPRRAAQALAPTRLLRLDDPPRQLWATAIARTVPKWLVDGIYETVVGSAGNGGQPGNGHGHRAGRGRGRSAHAASAR